MIRQPTISTRTNTPVPLHDAIPIFDAGCKSLSTDGGVAVVRRGAPESAFFAFMGDEHAALIAPGIGDALAPGDPVTLTVPHCDPTVNLYDHIHVVRSEEHPSELKSLMRTSYPVI